MAKKCNACGRYANATEGVACTKCSGYHHRACVNIPNDAELVSGWICPSCKAQTPGNTDLPVRGEKADYASTSHQTVPSCDTCTELLKEIRLANNNIFSFKSDLEAMKKDISVFRSVVEGIGGRIDNMEMRLLNLEKKSVELQSSQGETGAGGFISVIDQLKAQINDQEQECLINDLEISGIPEEQGENPLHIVRRIADKLGVVHRNINTLERPFG